MENNCFLILENDAFKFLQILTQKQISYIKLEFASTTDKMIFAWINCSKYMKDEIEKELQAHIINGDILKD